MPISLLYVYVVSVVIAFIAFGYGFFTELWEDLRNRNTRQYSPKLYWPDLAQFLFAVFCPVFNIVLLVILTCIRLERRTLVPRSPKRREVV